MGVYLAKPKTLKESEDGGDFALTATRFGLSAMQGWRQYMEDAHLANPNYSCTPINEPIGLFGVFDGHGGPAVSEWVAINYPEILASSLVIAKEIIDKKSLSPQLQSLGPDILLLCEALQLSFLKLDEAMQTEANRKQLKKIHEESEDVTHRTTDDDSEEENDHKNQQSLLNSLLSGVDKRPIVRVIQKDGQKYYQLISRDKQHLSDYSTHPSYQDDLQNEEEDDKTLIHSPLENQFEKNDELTVDSSQSLVSTPETINHINEPQSLSSSSLPTCQDIDVSIHLDKTFTSCPDTVEDVLEQMTTDVKGQFDDAERPDMTCGIHDVSSAVINDEIVISSTHDVSHPETDIHENYSNQSFFDHKSHMDDDSMKRYHPENCGSTAIVVLVIGGSHPLVIAANAGDSRAVLCRNGIAVPLSWDHKPGLPVESNRIYKAGGQVLNGRVDGNLNLSRAVGDLIYKDDLSLPPEKQKITSFPDVQIAHICPDDQFIILACDGIWDCLTNQQAVDFVLSRLNDTMNESITLSKICEDICDYCLAGSAMDSEGGIGCDNMTVLIVQLGESLRKQADHTSTIYSSEPLIYQPVINDDSLNDTQNGLNKSSFNMPVKDMSDLLSTFPDDTRIL